MATANLTFGSVLGTVNKAANTVTTTLDVVSNTADMLNAFVARAKENQLKGYAIEREEGDQRLLDKLGLEESQRRAAIQQTIRQNPELEPHFIEARARYAKILAKLNSEQIQSQSQGGLRVAAE